MCTRIKPDAARSCRLSSLMKLTKRSPDQVAEQIIAYNRRLGVNVIIPEFQWVGTPHSQVLDALHLFAEEVMPRVRSAT
jgi:hypothetical protein